MSDFMRRLVERAQDRVVRLERRRPSLFEARGPAAADLRQVDERPLQMPSTSIALAAAWETSRKESVDTAQTPTRLPVPPRPGSLTHDANPAMSRRAIAAPTLTPTVPTRRDPDQTVPEQAQPSPIASNDLPAPAPLSTRAAPQRPMPTLQREPQRGPASEPVRTQLEVRIEREHASTPAPVSATNDTDRATLPLPARLQAREPIAAAVAHPSRRAAAQARTPAAAPPPPVQVSIGRVEIRATAASAAPPARAPARTSAPALDDYLRRRHGGQR